jgi:hypothetical protein
LQRRALSRLRITLLNSNNLGTNHRSTQTPIPLSEGVPVISDLTIPTYDPLLRISSVPLARLPLQLLQQIRHQLGPCTIVCSDCRALHWIEEKSAKATRRVPKFTTCCMNGAISLPPLPDAPILIEKLLKDESNGNYHDIS